MLSACGRGSAREVAGPVNRSRVETGNGAAASGLREDITRFNKWAMSFVHKKLTGLEIAHSAH